MPIIGNCLSLLDIERTSFRVKTLKKYMIKKNKESVSASLLSPICVTYLILVVHLDMITYNNY